MSNIPRNVWLKNKLHQCRWFATVCKRSNNNLTYRQFEVMRSLATKATSMVQGMRSCSRYSRATAKDLVDDHTVHSEKKPDLALFPNPSELNMFVPKSEPVQVEDVKRMQDFVNHSKRLLIMTGAGISTESGIPDYRSEAVGLYARSTNRPVRYQDFVKDPNIRQRYWARNYVSWPKFGFFLPNKCHVALAEWEKRGKVHWLVTQNVDALHYKAGSENVTELHGSAHRVMCLGCDHKMTRPEMQALLDSYNTNWNAKLDEIAPDADVQLFQEQINDFKVPPCPSCGGPLKPEITFVGDNVLKPVVECVHEKVKECDRVLFIGTSLQVYSGYRFAIAASDQDKPVAILNIGPTRADKLARLHIHAKCGDVLPKIQVLK